MLIYCIRKQLHLRKSVWDRAYKEAQLTQNNGEQTVIGGDQIQVGNIQEAKGIAIGQGATAVHVDALGDVGDVITGTKISLVNRAAAQRVGQQAPGLFSACGLHPARAGGRGVGGAADG